MPPHRYRSVSVSDLICIRLFCGLRKCGNEGKRASRSAGPPSTFIAPESKLQSGSGPVRFGLSHARAETHRHKSLFWPLNPTVSESTSNLACPPLFLCEIISYAMAGIPLVLVNAPFPTMTDQKSFCLCSCLSWLARSCTNLPRR